MPEYNQQPVRILEAGGRFIHSYISETTLNIDHETVSSFGEEWATFQHFSKEEIESAAKEYFDIVPSDLLTYTTNVLDLGCGSGRWSLYIADRVGKVEAIDPSTAVIGATKLLAGKKNVRVTQAAVSNIPFEDQTFDFLMCLGVLHHIPDTVGALSDAMKKVKAGGHALLYFYYNLENRSRFYKLLFSLTDLFRRMISRMPSGLKRFCCDVIAITIYLPLICLAKFIRMISPRSNFYQKIPLSYYINKPFRIARNDALDRFGTPLEQRFSKEEIRNMLKQAGCDEIIFSENMPYWHCLARKKV